MRLIDADDFRDEWRWQGQEYSPQDIIEEIDDAPTIEERKRGRWEMKPDPYGFFDEIPVCSECGCTTKMRETYKYCPNCGARMERREE